MAKAKKIETVETVETAAPSAVPPTLTGEQRKLYAQVKLTNSTRSSLAQHIVRNATKGREEALGKAAEALATSILDAHFGAEVMATYRGLPPALVLRYGALDVQLVDHYHTARLYFGAHTTAAVPVHSTVRVRRELFELAEAHDREVTALSKDKDKDKLRQVLNQALAGCRTLAQFLDVVPDALELLGSEVDDYMKNAGISTGALTVSKQQVACAIGRAMGVVREGCAQEGEVIAVAA